MFPWFWFWAPQVHFPWSGAVTQRINPNLSWFSDLIEPGAGDPEIERKAFGIASYGKQLGLLTEVLIGVAEQSEGLSPQAADSLARLRKIKAEIESVKAAHAQDTVQRLLAEVEALRRHGGEDFAQLSRQLRPLLGAPSN